jgi:hypothetical protein
VTTQRARVGRAAAEERGAGAQDVSPGVLRGRRDNVAGDQLAERLGPGDGREVAALVDLHRLDATDIPVLAACVLDAPLVADKEKQVAALDVGRALEEELRRLAGQRLRLRHLRLDRVPFGPRLDLLDRLEGLRKPVGPGDALHLDALPDRDLFRRTLRGLEVERQVGARSGAWRELVADRIRELTDRAAFGRRAQEALVDDSLLIEGQDVEHARPGVDQPDRRVVVLASRQSGERMPGRPCDRQLPDHRLLEGAMRADAIGELGQPRRVLERERRQVALVLAATARVEAVAPGAAHTPPFIVSSSFPFSGRLGSLSRRTISRGPTLIVSASSSPFAVLP